MTKDEILEKSRQENKSGDEQDEKILSDSVKVSYAVMILSAAVFSLVRFQKGYPIMDLPAVCCVSVSANFLYRFIKTMEKWNLFIAVITLAAGIIAAVRFFMGY